MCKCGISSSTSHPAPSVQFPLSTNGDSVYCKDVWPEQSITAGWEDTDSSGDSIACIPFTNLHTRITNATSTNPKILLIHFNRTVFAAQIGLGCTGGGNFSNVVIKLLGSGGTIRTTADESADSTKRTSRDFKFVNQKFNAVQLEFHTVDEVCLSNITIQKISGVSVDQVESTTNSLKVINYSHAELHSGDHFLYASHVNILKNTAKEFLVISPDTERWAHMTVGFDPSTSEFVIDIYENATVSSNGTLLPAMNRNRNFTDDNTTLIYEDPTLLTDGTQLPVSRYLGAGKNLPGGGARDSSEILLKQNTIYLVRITEQNLSDSQVNYDFDWYEHTNLGE